MARHTAKPGHLATHSPPGVHRIGLCGHLGAEATPSKYREVREKGLGGVDTGPEDALLRQQYYRGLLVTDIAVVSG